MAVFDFSPSDLHEAGWAIVFHNEEDEAVKSALQPLIEHRRKQISDPELVKVLDYRNGESAREWLARHKVDFGYLRPDHLPYYLLMVGSPERMPFQFSQTLSLFYGIGRLHFDEVENYRRYVESLIRYDNSTSAVTEKNVVFFGPDIENDRATKFSVEQILKPLADEKNFFARLAKVARVEYASRLIPPKEATKERLLSIFRPEGSQLPTSLLFAATHGVDLTPSKPEQRQIQGALLCQDYPGASPAGLKPEHFFAANDLPADARVFGMTCFLFASHSVGAPERENLPGGKEQIIADKPFFAALPQALLSHNRGSALGVIGLINRGWLPTSGFGEKDADTKPNRWAHLQPYENAISNILRGWPLGYALREFNDRYAAFSAQMAFNLDKSGTLSDRDMAALWLERAFVEGLALFGDPAAKINTSLLQ